MRPVYQETPCSSALSRVKGMAFRWSLNPYVGCAHRCTFCYVRSFEQRAGRASGTLYGSSIRVKVNIADVLREQVGRRGWKREHVAIGSGTDPYQPAEGRYRLTRACLQVLATARTPASIVTRGPMVVRDIDVLRGLAGAAGVTVSLSIPTLDEHVWRTTEPGAASPRQRLRALERLATAGVTAGIAVAPIIPGLSDAPAQVKDVIRAARDAGAAFLWSKPLYLQPGARDHFLDELSKRWPQEAARHASLYRATPYLPGGVTRPLEEMVDALRLRFGIPEKAGLPVRAAPLQPSLL